MTQHVAPPLGHGRYQPVELLGAGGMAFVYRALDTRLECERAVKVLKPELDDLARERFFNEARTMAKLHHKNVVLVHDVADDGDFAYLVMELIEGGSIADRMAAFGPLPPRMAAEVTIAMLSGLEAAHAAGVVHRDVKPHNILVDSEGTPKVTDFGIAQAEEHTSTRTGAVIGTWAYMAPEQRTDSKGVDARADLFAVGCTLYNMLTGTDPFDLYNQEIYEQLYAPVPEAFRPIIQCATRYRPADRYATAAEFRAALTDLLADLPADPPDTPPLGISLEGERAAIVPTMMSSPAVSSPTLSAPALGSMSPTPAPTAEASVAPSWTTVVPAIGLTMLAFVFIGTGIASLFVSGMVVIANESRPEPAPVVVADTVAPAVPELDLGTFREPVVERAEAEPEEVVVPVESNGVDEPAPAPVRSADGYVVSVTSRPAGTKIAVDGKWYSSGTFSGELATGRHQVQYENKKAKGKYKTYAIVVQGPMNVCWDLAANGPCL